MGKFKILWALFVAPTKYSDHHEKCASYYYGNLVMFAFLGFTIGYTSWFISQLVSW